VRLGICCGPQRAKFVQEVGYDYVELDPSRFLTGTDEQFQALKEQMQDLDITVDAFNCLFPGSMKVVGPERDLGAIEDYLQLVFPRARALGGRIIVFGSGKARSYPEDFSREEAMMQMREFLAMAGHYASLHDLLLCVEPLRRQESNVINTLREAYALIQEIEADSVGLVADLWHMMCEGEPFEVIGEVSDVLYHVHVADQERLAPGTGDFDFAAFFNILRKNGYDRRVSCEFKIVDFEQDAVTAHAFLRQFLKS
jgi:sugar phosphate isomerase/epimerase